MHVIHKSWYGVSKTKCYTFRSCSYLENQHLRHCVPSNVSSGLATRPLSFVYMDGFPNKSSPTTKKLPTGELIQGNMSYTNILPYFTSSDITPDEIYRKGQEMVSKTYSQVRKGNTGGYLIFVGLNKHKWIKEKKRIVGNLQKWQRRAFSSKTREQKERRIEPNRKTAKYKEAEGEIERIIYVFCE